MAVSKSRNSTSFLPEKVFGPSRICVVSTSLAYCWKSKQELIPAIEDLWRHSAKRLGAQIVFLDPFSGALATKVKILMGSDVVVMTTLVPDLVVLLRQQLKTNVRFVFHTQGEAPGRGGHFASIAHLLNSQDLFFANSRAEQRAIRLCFPNARAWVLPSPVLTEKGISAHPKRRILKGGAHQLGCYVGRISEQKNLHTVLMGLWTIRDSLLDSGFQFHIFGAPDGLGSPYMGMKGTPYLRNLQRWTKILGLQQIVRWRGFRPAVEIQNWMGRNQPLFVSLSLHSDEDLGVAALKAIHQGCGVLLSHWGGHIDFRRHFPQQVQTVPVFDTQVGPVVSALEMGKKFLRFLSLRNRKRQSKILPGIYATEVGSLRLLRILGQSARRTSPLLISSLVKKRTNRKIWYEKIFTGYRDPIARQFFFAYGMSRKTIEPSRARRVVAPPWVRLREKVITVRDPHRGGMQIPILKSRARTVEVRALNGARKYQIDFKQAQHLLRQGILIPLS